MTLLCVFQELEEEHEILNEEYNKLMVDQKKLQEKLRLLEQDKAKVSSVALAQNTTHHILIHSCQNWKLSSGPISLLKITCY